MFKQLLARFMADAPSAPAPVIKVDMQDMHTQILRQNRLKRMERNDRRRAASPSAAVPRTT